MNIDEELSELTQGLHRHGLTVHIRPRAAVDADHPAQHAFVLVFDGLLGEPGERRRIGAQVEGGGHFGSLRPVPYDFGAGASARRKQQRIDKNGLARASFSREHRQAGTGFEFDSVDNREVANLDMREHARSVR